MALGLPVSGGFAGAAGGALASCALGKGVAVMGGNVVAVCGSRSLPVGGATLVGQVVGSLLAAGRSLVVGCCVGADAAALAVCPASGPVSVLAAFGPGGEGAGPWSAVPVVRAFARAGGAVSWWAGGPAAVPLAVRLRSRTEAVAKAGSGGVVAFLASPASVGSLVACRAAARLGRPVAVFPLGFAGEALPLLGPGRWEPVGGSGVWAEAWVWAPEAGLF